MMNNIRRLRDSLGQLLARIILAFFVFLIVLIVCVRISAHVLFQLWAHAGSASAK